MYNLKISIPYLSSSQGREPQKLFGETFDAETGVVIPRAKTDTSTMLTIAFFI